VYGSTEHPQGGNVLDNPPYEIVLPETTLPLTADGRDALLLLDREYEHLDSYFRSIYPRAQIELERLPDGGALYTRVRVMSAEIAALQGLKQTLTFGEGAPTEALVPGVVLAPPPADLVEAVWEGSLRVPHGGRYEMRAGSELQLYLDGRPWTGAAYLGRGLYGLRAVLAGPASEEIRLQWRVDEGDFMDVPADVFFAVPGHQHGLRSLYWNNMNWEGAPEFQQVTPFLLLAWPDEEPIMPRGPFSASYRGFLQIPIDGEYAFRVEADDGARLLIDGSVAGDALVAGRPNAFEAALDLGAGEHRIQVDYFQQGGGSGLKLLWRMNGDEWIPIAPEYLLPAEP